MCVIICTGGKGGLSALDLNRAVWQKISRKGDFPSTRCGSAIAMYKSKALLFGGVFDEEGEYWLMYLFSYVDFALLAPFIGMFLIVQLCAS